MVNRGPVLEKLLLLALGETSGDDHALGTAALFEVEHLVDGGKRLGAGSFDEAASVDDDEIGTVGVADEVIAVDFQQAEHPLAIDEVFRTAEADEGVGAFRGRAVGGRAAGHGGDGTTEGRKTGGPVIELWSQFYPEGGFAPGNGSWPKCVFILRPRGGGD